MKRSVIILVLLLGACSTDKPSPEPQLSVLAEVNAPGEPTLFTHGDDPRQPKPPGLAAETPVIAEWPCEGDGTSGRRVQAIYAHGAGSTLTATIRTSIEGYVRQVEGVFLSSAQATGGSRLVRFVTDSSCNLSILDVTLSQNGLASFDMTRAELSSQGLNHSDRIYHSWVEGSAYCGIGTIIGDDSPTNNYSETIAAYSRSDRQCWAYAEPHEIVHNMGGVQLSAPHSTGGYHCNDEFDLLCYSDGGLNGTMTYPCSDATGESRLDCNHDDFFSTAPSPGSYLDSHWNVANSSALSSSTATTVPPSSTTSTVPPSTTSTTIGTVATNTNLSVPSTIRSGVSFTASATVDTKTGRCLPEGTVIFSVSGTEMSRQILSNGKASVVLTVTGGAARPTIRAEYTGSATCAKSADTARPRLR